MANYVDNLTFYYTGEAGGPADNKKGDVNCDDEVNIADVNAIIERLKAFHGHVIIQTMFMRGECHGESVDNTSDTFIAPWLEAVKEIRPQQVMIYTIDRETPTQGLLKATHEQLDAIRDKVIAEGIPCTASY